LRNKRWWKLPCCILTLLLPLLASSTTALADGPYSQPYSPTGARPTIVTSSSVMPSGFTSCTTGLCFWEDANYSGYFWAEIGTGGGGDRNYNQWYYVGNYVNDIASSVYNDRPDGSLIDKDWPPSGDSYCILSQYAYSDLSQYQWQDGSGMNDSISSFNLTSQAFC
jgi:hypothetical protein